MITLLHGAASDTCWENVSSKTPCPKCGGESGCRLHVEDSFVLCISMHSDWPLTTGGWLHRDAVAVRTRRDSSGVYASYDVNGSRKALASRSSARQLVAGK